MRQNRAALTALCAFVALACSAAPAHASTVAAGGTHSCAIASAGGVHCWGANADGQLGDGTNTARSRAVAVSGVTDATTVAAGASHTCALIAGGTVKCWGQGANGRLGDGGTASSNTPVSVTGLTTAIQIAAGAGHTCALLTDLTVSCWGLNTSGQVGDGTNTQRLVPTPVSTLTAVTRIDVGDNHSCAATGGTVWCWGLGGSGQLGDGGTADSSTPVAAAGVSNASVVSAGANHSCTIVTAGAVKCWGLNADGQLGDGSTTQRNSPVVAGGVSGATQVAAGGTHTCSAQGTPLVQCWGRGASGELGDGLAAGHLSPTPASGITGALALSAGGQHTCAVNTSGPTQCWGENGSNQIGDGATTDRAAPAAVRLLNGAASVGAGSAHTCVARVAGTVACMGDNSYGQIGDGTSGTGPNPSPLTVPGIGGATVAGVGQYQSCAVDGAGQGQCWGRNATGQLGDNSTSQQTLPANAIGFTAGAALSGGNQHTCGFVSGGQAKCWGSNVSGQLGDGTNTQHLVPTDLPGLTNAVGLATGGSHSCAIASGGQAKCWGLGNQGQLGNGGTGNVNSPANVTGVTTATSIGAGAQHACATLADGTARCWGANSNGQLGDNSTSQSNSAVTVSGLTGATSIEGGDAHSCAIVAGGAVKCWGANNAGQLGDGNASGVESHVPVDVYGVSGAVALALGAQHSCALTDSGRTLCWGYNVKGQLGDGTINNQPYPSASDLLEPVVNVTAPGEGAMTGDTTPDIHFSLIEDTVSTPECSIDGGAWTVCFVSPYTVPTPLAQGVHTVAVRATDANGNVGLTTRTFSVGTPPPSVSIDSPVSGATIGDATPSVSFTTTGSEPLSAECRVDAGALAPCTSPYTAATMSEGAHTVTVNVTDGFANTATASVSFTVDTVLPGVAVTSPADGTVLGDNTPTVSFTATDATALTVECRVDAGPFVACSSPFTSGTLADGAHTIVVRATDAAGNVGTDSVPLTVDTTVPGVAITAPADASTTSDSTPNVSFTVTDATATAKLCRVDGGSYGACASPFTTATLADGPHTVDVQATDAAGNVGTASVSLTVDTVAPAVSITAPADAATINDNTPSVSFTVTDATATAKECRVDAGAYGACASPFTPTALSEGAHSVTVRATDAAGQATTATVSFTVDSIAPGVAVTAPADASTTSDSTPNVSFTVTDATATAKLCRVDGGSYGACASPFTTATLADGPHTVDVQATDAAGNVGTASVSLTVDTTLPAVAITAPAGGSTTGDPTPNVTFTVTDATALAVQCRVDAGGYGACSSPFTPATLADGPHTVDVRATDAAGNVGNGSVNFTVDTSLPVVNISSPANGAALTDTQPPVTFTASGAGTLTVECQVDGGAFAACSSPFTPPMLTEGPHSVAVRATDPSSNVATATVNFTVDTNPPVVTITSPNDFDTLTDATPDVTFTVTDSTATTVECRVDTGGYVPCVSPYTTPSLSDGWHDVIVRATDAAGSVSSNVVGFNVDANLPAVTIDSPADGGVTSDATPDVTFTATDFSGVTTACRVDAGVFAPCGSPFTAATLADGPHTVDVRATDGAGNQATASVSMTVDTTAPVVAIGSPADGALTLDATPSVIFGVTDATSTSTECAVDAGAFASCSSVWTAPTLTDGLHTLTVRASDQAGNQGTAAVNLTVDASLPVVAITAPAGGSVTSNTTPAIFFTVTDASATSEQCRIDAGAFGACASPLTTATLADGSHTVTVRSTDAAGNQGSASVTLTVDTTSPAVSVTAPAGGSTTGDSTPDVSFTVTDATAVTSQCRVDGGSYGACASPWTAPVLADGSHTVDVLVTDAAGNSGSGSVTFTVDTTLPNASITAPAGGSITADNTPSVSFTATGSAPLTTACRVDAGAFAPCGSPFTAAVLADGSHTVTVRVTDSLARTATAAVTFTVDATAPAVAITAPANGSAVNNVTPATVFTATDSAGLNVLCSVDAGPFAPCSSPYTLPTLAEGPHAVQVRATDTAGNQTTGTSNFDVDLTVPVVTISSPADAATVISATPTISFSGADASFLTYACQVDGGAFAACNSPYVTPSLTNALHAVTVRATDAAGNQSTSSVSFTVSAPVTAPPATPPPALPKPVPAAANLRAKRSRTKIKLVFSVYLPAKSTASCAAPVLIKAKFKKKKTVRVRASMTGVGPFCQLKPSLKIPRGAKGVARINAMFFGNTEAMAVDADVAVKVK